MKINNLHLKNHPATQLTPIPNFDRYLLNLETKEVYRVNLPKVLYLQSGVERRVKMKPVRPSWGYGGLRVELWKDGVAHKLYLHQIIALCLLPNPAKKPYVKFLDNNPLNLTASNLKWTGCPAGL